MAVHFFAMNGSAEYREAVANLWDAHTERLATAVSPTEHKKLADMSRDQFISELESITIKHVVSLMTKKEEKECQSLKENGKK